MSTRQLDVGALAGVPVGPRTLTLYYRHVHLPVGTPPDPLRTSAGTASRWATAAGTLYTAATQQVAWSEYCRQVGGFIAAADPTGGIGLTPNSFAAFRGQELGDPVPRRALYGLRMEFERVADLMATEARNALRSAGFDFGDLYVDGYGRCPEVAQAGEALGWQALIAPSAAWRRPDGVSVPVFEAGKPRPSQVLPLLTAARPSIAVAYLTHYKTADRPSWLTF